MATPGVGQDIEDTCGRCGDTWHVVAAKVGERVVKVVCKLCGTQHNYRGSGNAPASAGGKRSGGARKRSSAEPAIPTPPPFDASRPPRPYSVKDTYAPGDRINHPKFGVGVVATATSPGKVEVVFPDGLRVLACAKGNSSLERPKQVDVPISDRPPERT